MQDQRLAVEWIHENIASFGGSPSLITIFGQSSGSVAVDYWAFAYPSVSYFLFSSILFPS